jgi:hypothetical protein
MSTDVLTWPFNKLFQKPSIPPIQVPPPPAPQKNTPMEAQLAQAGRQQGLLATLFGFKSPSGTSTSAHTMTGQG